MAFELRNMLRRAGIRRRRVRFRLIRPRPAQVRELDAIYQTMVELWAAGVARLVESYGSVKPDIVRDTATDDMERLLQLIAWETSRAMVRLSARVRGWAQKTETWHRQAWADGVFAATSVRIDTILSEHDVRETVSAVVNRNVELIRNIDAEARGRIGDIVFRGVNQRVPTATVAREIREAVDMSRTRARNIAADQTTKLTAALNRARQEEAGIRHFVWRHSRKRRPRLEHVARDGRLYKWRASTAGPGSNPPDDMPGELPWCGCAAQAVLVDEQGKVL